ncbi:MAG: zinc ribbon domain-containing protein [Gemmatimonadota bacterium]
MLIEAAAALVLGALVLAFVVSPLLRRNRGRVNGPVEWIDPEETPKGIALAALKEIEFDRETGKLSDTDYQMLMARYTGQAVEAMRAEDETGQSAAGEVPPSGVDSAAAVESVIAAKVRAIRSGGTAPSCPTCGPRPESDAIFCSHCGTRLPTGHACDGCGSVLPSDGRFCESCGRKVAA